MTEIVKEWGTTLAIGDGANDVHMINSAHVGVGVRGIEGSQATRAADYVLGEFKLLRRLLLFHGVNFSWRNSTVMLYTLYKNMLSVLPILLYGMLSLESSLFIYDKWVFQFYNVLFVNFPIVYLGLFDTPHPYARTLTDPNIYRHYQLTAHFNFGLLFRQLLLTTLEAATLVGVVYCSANGMLASTGLLGYQEWAGMAILSTTVIVCNLRILVLANQINLFLTLACLAGIALYYLTFLLISSASYDSQACQHLLLTPLYWLVLASLCGCLLLPRLILKCMQMVTILRRAPITCLHGNMSPDQMVHQPMHSEDLSPEDSLPSSLQSIEHGYAFSEDDNRSKILTPKKPPPNF